MTSTAVRRNSWVLLLPRATINSTPITVTRDLALREMKRNAPEVFVTGILRDVMIDIDWTDLYTPAEVEIIHQGAGFTKFDHFIAFMKIIYPDAKDNTLLHRSMKYWNQIENNRGN